MLSASGNLFKCHKRFCICSLLIPPECFDVFSTIRAVLMGTKSCTKILILPKIFPTRFRFTFYGQKYWLKIFPRFSDGRKCALLQTLGPRFLNGSLHENLRAARQICCAASLDRKMYNKNVHSMYGGECDAAIAKAAAGVTRV